MQERCCKTCRFVGDEADEDDDEEMLRCGVPIPFWVPIISYDFKSWVDGSDGQECQTWQPKIND